MDTIILQMDFSNVYTMFKKRDAMIYFSLAELHKLYSFSEDIEGGLDNVDFCIFETIRNF